MHFLPTLFALVLFVPLFKIAVTNPAFGFVILLCLFVKRDIDVWMWGALHEIKGFDYLVRAVKVVTYLGYGFLAASCYGLVNRGITRVARRQLALFTLFVGILLFLLKLVYSYKVIYAADWQYNYTAAFWADFAMPAVLFLGLLFWGRGIFPSRISKIAPFSFGLYLCHPIFLDLIEINAHYNNFGPSTFVLFKFFGGLLGTGVFVFMLSRIPLLAWTIGMGGIPSFPKSILSFFGSSPQTLKPSSKTDQ